MTKPDRFERMVNRIEQGTLHRYASSTSKANVAKGQLEHGLPNTCTLYWHDNGVGGRVYFSDEIGGGVLVWDTSLVEEGTLLAAMAQEYRLNYEVRRRKK